MKKRIDLRLFDDTVQGKIDRKYMAHFIDSGSLCHGEEEEYERLGENLEEYNVEMNPDTETKQNILGENSFQHNGYEVSSEADPYYARTDSTLSQKLQEIIDNRHKDDNCKTSTLEVHLWKGDGTAGYEAYKQDAYIIPTSYGGDTSGYQIPFTVNYVGERTKGIYKPDAKTFTPDSASAGTGG